MTGRFRIFILAPAGHCPPDAHKTRSGMKPIAPFVAALMMCGLSSALAQADCNTEQGVLALTVARVAVGPVQTAADLPGESGLPFRFVSELFRARQDSSTNVRCLPMLSFHVYLSRDADLLRRLPEIAESNPDFTPPKGVIRVALRASYQNPADKMQRSVPKKGENTFFVYGGPATSPYPAGALVHYRVAKRIKRCSTCSGVDPMRFSDTQSFTVPR